MAATSPPARDKVIYDNQNFVRQCPVWLVLWVNHGLNIMVLNPYYPVLGAKCRSTVIASEARQSRAIRAPKGYAVFMKKQSFRIYPFGAGKL
jgi:hypothetical protein